MVTETLQTLQLAEANQSCPWAEYSTGVISNLGCALPTYMPCVGSAAEQVADLYKQLPAIVDVAILSSEQARAIGIALLRSGLMNAQRRVQFLQVGVVADIDRGSWMQKIGEQNVEVQVLHGLQRRVLGIGQQSVVLRDKAQRELARELVVPLGSYDVAVDHGMVHKPVGDSFENVSVVDLKAIQGFDSHGLGDRGFIPGVRQSPGGGYDYHGSIPNDASVPAEHAPWAATEHQADRVLRVAVVVRKAREIDRPQRVCFVRDDGDENASITCLDSAGISSSRTAWVHKIRKRGE